MKKFYQKIFFLFRFGSGQFCISLCLISGFYSAHAQCPVNLDFETGTFAGWDCSTGTVTSNTGVIVWNTCCLPVATQHTMLTSPPGNGRDYYGNFSQNCPNGSGHSIMLGNAQTGRGAERVSYEFIIPPGRDKFSLIYNYAVVLQDFGHTAVQQPRLSIEVLNVTDNTIDPCSSFDFVVNGSLPGFFVSPNSPAGAPVRCKDWSAASINLDGNAGKTIRLTFTTTDCSQGAHFGYAYIDVNAECSSSFVGATFCPDDTLVNITAPFGYQGYKWFDILNNILGLQQTLTLNPPPLSGDSVFVELTPYSGYGCVDTLTANLWDTLTIAAYAGRDTSICSNNPVQLGAPPTPGLVYSWSPTTGLSNPVAANPIATVVLSMTYILTVTNNGGGCATRDTVQVTTALLSDSLQLIGSASYCTATGLSAVLKVFPADSIQWYRNGIAIPGANQTTYTVTQSGSYHATLFSFAGCNLDTRAQQVDIYESPVAGFTTNAATQCFKANQFIFTNTSTIPSGGLQYSWDLGDGNSASSLNVTHSYAQPGIYTVKLVAFSPAGGSCADSMSMTVTVFPGPLAGFTSNSVDQCFKNHLFIFTNTSTISAGNLQYSWDMGDGSAILTSKDVTYSFGQPGSYTVKMLVTDAIGGCKDSSSINVTVYPSPVAGFTINNPNQCFPNNQFVFTNTSTIFAGPMQYNWSLGDGASASTPDITHSYAQPGVYTVKLLVSATGSCADSMSFTVTVYPVAYAEFIVSPVCTNLRVPIINRTKDVPGTTINYLWDFGNSNSSVDRIPVYKYLLPGTYTISLSVNTTQCPMSVSTKTQTVVIDAPAPAINYPIKNTISYFREPLQARNIGNSVLWLPATSLDDSHSYKPLFYGLSDQLYTIQLRTPSGCLTVDTQLVKTRDKIKIYVPTVFTPGEDGKNDYLRPYLLSIAKVNYFRVYNRWGKLLYEMRGDRPGWDGRVNGQMAELQTVIWTIEAVDVSGKTHREQGTTILMR